MSRVLRSYREMLGLSAGALCLALLDQAGLTNAGSDAVARELDALRLDLADANAKAHEAYLKLRSLRARNDKLLATVNVLNAERRSRKPRVFLGLRDPLPSASLEELTDAGARVAWEREP